MNSIYIDATDRHEKIVQLFINDKLDSELKGDLDIVSSIKALLKEKNLKINDVLFEFNPGPGSFTGLKISSTISNILNWSSGKAKIKDLKYPIYGSDPHIHQTKWLDK